MANLSTCCNAPVEMLPFDELVDRPLCTNCLETVISITCQDCGVDADDVRERLCPYALDINDTEVDIVVCDLCYQERADDI